MTAAPSGHAPWCDETTCGHRGGCFGSPDPGDPKVITARHQTAHDNRYGRTGDVVVFVNVGRHEPELRILRDGSDNYLVGVVIDRDSGTDITELDLTEQEARALVDRLTEACDMAAADRQAVAP